MLDRLKATVSFPSDEEEEEDLDTELLPDAAAAPAAGSAAAQVDAAALGEEDLLEACDRSRRIEREFPSL